MNRSPKESLSGHNYFIFFLFQWSCNVIFMISICSCISWHFLSHLQSSVFVIITVLQQSSGNWQLSLNFWKATWTRISYKRHWDLQFALELSLSGQKGRLMASHLKALHKTWLNKCIHLQWFWIKSRSQHRLQSPSLLPSLSLLFESVCHLFCEAQLHGLHLHLSDYSDVLWFHE